VHDGDLASRTPEVDETEFHPEPECLPEANRLDLRPLFRPLSTHIISTYQVNNSASLTTVVQEVKKRFADVASANLGHRPKLSGNRAGMPKG
jgi:hypothetical protein